MFKLLFLFCGKPDEIKNLFLKFGIMNTDATTTNLKTIKHQIMLQGAYFTRISIQQMNVFRTRGRKHMVRWTPFFTGSMKKVSFRLLRKQRKIQDPSKSKLMWIIFIFTQVGLVITIIFHGFRMSQTRQRFLHNMLFRKQLINKRGKHGFNECKYFFLRHKRKLHINLIKFTRAAVRTRIFITETWRYLEITLKTGNHQ